MLSVYFSLRIVRLWADGTDPGHCTIGTKADTARMFTGGLLKYLLMALDAFLTGKQVRYVFKYVRNPQ